MTNTAYATLTAAIAAVLPEETEHPDPRDTVLLVRQSERNRIKARLLAYADALLDTSDALDYDDADPSLTAAERNPTLR